MINLGNIEIADLRLGASQVKAVYFGNEQVWSGEQPAPIGDALCFTAEQNGSTLRLDKVGSPGAISLQTSDNEGATWKDYNWTGNTGDEFGNLNVGDKVYIRAKTENSTIGSSSSNYYKFVMTGQIAASGNIQTLLKADSTRTDAPSYSYYNLFYGCASLTTAPALPATTLASSCYSGMFQSCTSLTTAPSLPATTLANNCYQNMFNSCASLTTAPSLPATTLAEYCYQDMFNGCTSLTTAPALPATTLVYSCYTGMFHSCVSLTTAPTLPATTLANNCYQNMFQNCTSLTSAPELPATTLNSYCYYYMFSGCTSLTDAPKLPAPTTAMHCYSWMFSGCTSLSSMDVAITSWPYLAATQNWLENVSQTGVFKCSPLLPDGRGISNIPVGWTVEYDALVFSAEQAGSTVKLNKVGSPDAISLEYSTNGREWYTYSWANDGTGTGIYLQYVGSKVMFRASSENSTISKTTDDYYQFVMTGQVAATGNITSGNIQALLKADCSRTDAPAYCYSGMFNGCSSLTKAPKLPATTLGSYCYYSMFADCTALTSAPKLPATTLADYCYSDMFDNCSSLSLVEVAFKSWPSNGATTNWLNNVAANGTFTCPVALPDIRGVSNIPVGWMKQESADTPLTFTATQANSTVHLDKVGSPDTIYLETSTDGSTWTDYSWSGNTGNTLTLANVGDKAYFRAKTENSTIGSSESNRYQFVMTGQIAASGNIQTILKADGSRTVAPAYCYEALLSGCTALTKAPKLLATTVNQQCYEHMFHGCSALTTAPELPAMSTSTKSYRQMFFECTSLSSTPELPATSLGSQCYDDMFHGCTALVHAADLPATSTSTYSYFSMFKGCTALTTGPNISATSMASQTAENMFEDCTSLSSVTVKFTSWPPSRGTTNWLRNVAANGTFTCPSTLPDTRDASHIPVGWTKADLT